MQDFNGQNNKRKKVSFQEFSLDEKQRLVGAFAWLIEQDKKQNPELYKSDIKKDDRYSKPFDSQG